MHRRAEDDTNAAGASVLEEAEKVDLVGALAQRGEDYAAPDLKPRPVGRVHFIEVRAAGGAKVDAERSSDGLSMSMFFKPCPERAMLLIAPSISTWRRPAKTFFKKPA